MNKFINTLDGNVSYDTSYDSGHVTLYQNDYLITRNDQGAEDMFSVGQPVYDKDNNLMGYLGIGLFSGLTYATEGLGIPVEYWKICLPTKYCERGKDVYTYWQMLERRKK